ncbi:MAG: helix-turn-helix domain-containing protein [Candidatus Competibacteraceae bacterium]
MNSYAHVGQLVTKDNLLNTVWPHVCVGDAITQNTIREIRQALRDDPRQPQFIETVHRRGYRLIK